MGIADSLKEQFDRGWRMVDATVSETPEDVWRTGGRNYLCPARLAYHIAETAEFYLSDRDEFPFGHRWCGPTLLDLALYVLRHTLHHHGEMNALSVLAGTDTDNWA